MERVRQRRSRPRRYSVPVQIHITDWTVVETEPEEKKERRIPTEYTPRFMPQDLVPSIDVLREVDPFMKTRPVHNLDEEESPEQNWILPPATGVDPDEGFSDPLQSPWDYLEMQLQSREEEYRNRMYPGRDEEQGESSEDDYLRQRQERDEGMLNAGKHLLYSNESYEDKLARDREDDEATSFRDGSGYEPVVKGTAADSEGEEDGYAMVWMSQESTDTRLLSDGAEGDDLYDEQEEEAFESLYGDDAMSRDGVSFLSGVSSESEEGGFSMTSRLLTGLDSDEGVDEATDRGRVSRDTRLGGFPVLSHTLRQTSGSLAAETRDATATETPRASWLSSGSSFRSPLGGRGSTPSFRGAPTGQPLGGRSIGRIGTPFSRPGSLSGTIRSPVSPGLAAPGPTTDFRSSPRRSPQTSPGIDVKNLDILMH